MPNSKTRPENKDPMPQRVVALVEGKCHRCLSSVTVGWKN
jgi:hypothetical protein